MSKLVEAACNCDYATTWHLLHRADCRLFVALSQLRYENGIAVNLDSVVAEFGSGGLA